MRINVRMVECFRAVMTTGTTTAAADLLHTSQPSISRALKQFETAIGLRLFDRINSRLEPTAHANAIFDEVQRTFMGLDGISRLAENLRTPNRGTISIVCAPAYAQGFIAEACCRFLHRFDGVSIEIEARRSWDITEAMNSQNFDLGLGSYSYSTTEAHHIPFAAPDEVCVVPRGHPLERLKIVTPEAMKGDKFIYIAQSSHHYRHRLDTLFDLAGVQRCKVIETSHSATACALVSKGAGIAIVNPFTALDFADQGLVMRAFSVSLPFTTTLWRAKHRANSFIVDGFILELNRVRDHYLTRARDNLL